MASLLLFRKQFEHAIDGGFIPSSFGWLLRITGILTIPGAIFASYKLWAIYSDSLKGVFNPEVLLTRDPLFIIVVQIVIVLCAYALLHLLWLRGSRIIVQQIDSEFSATPVIVMLLKAIGECVGLLWLFTGIMGSVLYWFGSEWRPLLPVPFVGNSIVNGLISITAGFVYGGVVVLVVHFVAEMIGVMPHIAQSLRQHRH